MVRVASFFRIRGETIWKLSGDTLAGLQRRFPSVEFHATADAAEFATALCQSEIFLGFEVPREYFVGAKWLRWAHSFQAGVEASLFPDLVTSEVLLTNGSGLHDVVIPEHVIGAMLALARNFHFARDVQSRAAWDRLTVATAGGGMRRLAGSTVAVLGAGPIGEGITSRLNALGAHVHVMRRRPGRPVYGAEAMLGASDLHALLAWADFVVIALPLTSETRNIIDAQAISRMKPGAFLINVGRGEMLDEVALLEALRAGRLAGAALDVFHAEPLPAADPLWAEPRVLLTPHLSGFTLDYFDRSLDLFEDNLRRFLAGEPLRNVVDKRLGYVVRE